MSKLWAVVIRACIGLSIVNAGATLAHCAGAEKNIQHGIIQTSYAAELAVCRERDTYEKYLECACEVDKRYGVDAGVGCP